MHCSLSTILLIESVIQVVGTIGFFDASLCNSDIALIVNYVFITSRMDLEDCISLNSVSVWKYEQILIILRGIGEF